MNIIVIGKPKIGKSKFIDSYWARCKTYNKPIIKSIKEMQLTEIKNIPICDALFYVMDVDFDELDITLIKFLNKYNIYPVITKFDCEKNVMKTYRKKQILLRDIPHFCWSSHDVLQKVDKWSGCNGDYDKLVITSFEPRYVIYNILEGNYSQVRLERIANNHDKRYNDAIRELFIKTREPFLPFSAFDENEFDLTSLQTSHVIYLFENFVFENYDLRVVNRLFKLNHKVNFMEAEMRYLYNTFTKLPFRTILKSYDCHNRCEYEYHFPESIIRKLNLNIKKLLAFCERNRRTHNKDFSIFVINSFKYSL